MMPFLPDFSRDARDMARSEDESEAPYNSCSESETAAAPARLPWFVAKVRATGGSKCDLPVLDLSAGGCLVELGFRAFNAGDRVLVSLPGLAACPAEVVWIEERNAGIAFENVLHEAVLQHLIDSRTPSRHA